MQLCLKSDIIKQNFINVHNIYNLFFDNYNDIINRDSLNAIKQKLRMQNKNVIIKKFNLHYFL